MKYGFYDLISDLICFFLIRRICRMDSQYTQYVKNSSRSTLIEHAVKCLTTERQTSVCVKRNHPRNVLEQYEQLCRESGEQDCFTAEEREGIGEGITEWEKFHDSQLQTRKPSDLRVCYLAGDNPINDLEPVDRRTRLYNRSFLHTLQCRRCQGGA